MKTKAACVFSFFLSVFFGIISTTYLHSLNYDKAFTKEEKRFHSYHEPIAENLQQYVGFAELQGKRSTMEDTLCIRQSEDGRYCVFGVFDGHGGEKTALFIAQELPTALLQALEIAEYSEELITTLWASLDDQCLGLNDGCTAVVALLDTYAQKVYLINLGDSRTIVLDKNGELVTATVDHKPNDPAEKQRIEEAGGFIAHHGCWRVDGRLALSRSFGDFYCKPLQKDGSRAYHVSNVPDIIEVDLQKTPVATMVLACDGVWDVGDNDKVVRRVNRYEGMSLGAQAQDLVRWAYRLGSTDNISAMVVDVAGLVASFDDKQQSA
jgi:protein phosphatase 1L